MNTNDMTPQTATGNRARRATALGVTAGVVGGGLVGLLMAVPSITSAANEDTGDTVVAALQESADTPADDATTDERPDPGTHLREALQPLVDDGTIEAGQADAVAEYLAQNRPERDGPRGPRGPEGPRGHGPAFDGEVVAGLLGMDVDEFRTAIRDGQSIADLAAANDVDVQTVIDALVAEAEDHLDLAVESGRLTDDEATDMLANITDRITARVNGERPARG